MRIENLRSQIVGLLVVLWLLCFVGCTSTVTPRVVTDKVASWDGTNQNSGLLFFLADGSMAITQHARERYNGLVKIYGGRFVPPLTNDAGITLVGTNIVMDPERVVKFSDMNRWKKSGK